MINVRKRGPIIGHSQDGTVRQDIISATVDIEGDRFHVDPIDTPIVIDIVDRSFRELIGCELYRFPRDGLPVRDDGQVRIKRKVDVISILYRKICALVVSKIHPAYQIFRLFYRNQIV